MNLRVDDPAWDDREDDPDAWDWPEDEDSDDDEDTGDYEEPPDDEDDECHSLTNATK